ncbi:MAG: holo-ACP synthase [Chromatiales bacterium]|jgi:holo-[acyl-carrier protein] synthase|nr:holo-ACP synthase [Chromatiales bacterium]MDX9767550.1 holo-ACP synthase [Ectothiorhodospiraceae bacterium]
MRIVGIGTDIVHVPRIEAALQRFGQRFARRVLHENEIAARDGDVPPAFVARRFAAKEAVAKALGVGMGAELALNEVEVWNDPRGRPHLRLHGRSLETARRLGVDDMHLSISDEFEYAMAYVILTTNG